VEITPVPCLQDNYAYLLVEGDDAVVVDPSEAAPVLAALGDRRLVGVWLTHHHHDHVGGVEEIVDARGPVEVVGSRHDGERGRIPRQTRAVGEGDRLAFGDTRVLDIPGHTLGAVAYVTAAGDAFTGDTLFCAGCGRVFEGTMPMMRDSLAKLRALDPATRVWCGHEYTGKNLAFARSMLPDDAAIAARRAEGCTVPSTIGEERRTNVFLRWDDPALAGYGPDVFATLRHAKDRY
jgi:hydroxyacylglutathione hydrolase